jgi:hypothetical protein
MQVSNTAGGSGTGAGLIKKRQQRPQWVLISGREMKMAGTGFRASHGIGSCLVRTFDLQTLDFRLPYACGGAAAAAVAAWVLPELTIFRAAA